MTKSGFYKNGKSHEDGGIPVLVDGSKEIEVELHEYKLCNNAIESTKIFEFKDKTNKEILDEIFEYANCEFKQNEANSGDFIICKLAVLDKKKRNITGTAKEIINVMQSEKSCNVTNDSQEFKDGGEINKGYEAKYDNDETYTKWKNLVNMSKSELEKFYNSEDGKNAGLSSSEAKSQGIDSGRESARWIMKMKDTPKSEWSSDMWRWAKKQISFISRMSGMKGDLYDDKGSKTRKHTSLLIWGHNPEKFNNGGNIKSYSEDKYDDNGNICYWKTYTLNNSSISIDYCLDNFFKIDAIGTKELSRRQGDATKLVRYVKEIAVRNNFDRIDVNLPIDENTPRKEYSLEDYKKAVSFYKKNGFKFYKNSTVKMFIELKTKENENTNGKTEIDTSSNKLLIEKAILYISEGIRTAEKEPREYKKNELIDLEAKLCYNFAVANKLWITDIDVLGLPLSGGGNENELYYEEKTGIISKVNNLLNHGASVLNFLKYIQYHNLLFEANSYNLIGFTGFDNEANNIKNAIPYVMPIISQIYVTESVKASINEIKKYMQIIGFEKVDEFTYKNSKYIVSDLRPRNVLKDSEGNIHVIDNIIKTNEMQIGGEIIEIKPALEDVYNEYWFRSFSLNSAKMDLEIYSAISTDNKDRYFKIRYISVDELEKRKGYATKLLNKAKELAVKTNYNKIDLTLPTDEFGIENYTSKDYNIAVSFYKKNGFEFVENSDKKMTLKLDVDKYNNGGSLKLMKWYIDWYKGISDKMNITLSLPNVLSPFKENNVVIMDLFEKIDQTIDAKIYLQEIINKADEYKVTLYLEPIPRYKYFLDDAEKIRRISKEYLISYYEKFGFELTNNGQFMKRNFKEKFKGGGEIKSNKTKPIRFEAGKKLTEAEKKEVYKNLNDSYKVNHRPYTEENDKIVWLDDASYYMTKSDITGRLLRWYIYLPDGSIAHPTEVFGASVNMSEIDRVQKNIESNEFWAKKEYDKVIESLKKQDEISKIVDAIDTAINNGAKFKEEYSSDDIGKRNKRVRLLFENGNNLSIPEYVINTKDSYLGLDKSDLVKHKIGEVRNKFLSHQLSEIDWEKFYNEFAKIKTNEMENKENIEYKGYNIYPYKTVNNNFYGVQSNENLKNGIKKGFGDALVDNIDEAKKIVESQIIDLKRKEDEEILNLKSQLEKENEEINNKNRNKLDDVILFNNNGFKIVLEKSKFTPLQVGKINKSLDTKYKSSNGVIYTLRERLGSGDFIGKSVSGGVFNRNYYNSLGSYKEQEKYEANLEKKKVYDFETKDNTFIEVPKVLYDAINFYNETEKEDLQKGIKVESEHKETAKKLYNQEITPEQAPESIAKEHLEESPKYYDELEKMESKLKTGSEDILKIALKDVISVNKYANLDYTEAKILYSLNPKKLNEDDNWQFDAITQTDEILKSLYNMDYISYEDNGKYDLSELGKDFIKSVDARIETLNSVEQGLDLFPQEANILEHKEDKLYNDIKSCLISEGEDDTSYIFEGKEFINATSGHNERWKFVSFFKYGAVIEHIAKNRLTTKKENIKITFDELRQMYKDDDISIDGVKDYNTLNNCLKLLSKCIDIIDLNDSMKTEIESHNETKKELKNHKLEKELKAKKDRENRELADELMILNKSILDSLNIESNGTLYEDKNLQYKYKEAMDKFMFTAIPSDKLPLDKEVHDILEDENEHLLNQYLYLSGIFGEKEKTKWIEFLKNLKPKSKEYFLNENIYLENKEPETVNVPETILPKDGSDIYINMPKMGHLAEKNITLKYDNNNFTFDIYSDNKKTGTITEREVLNNIENGLYKVIKQTSEQKEWKDAISTFEELISIGGSESELKEWNEAIDTFKMLLGDDAENESKSDYDKAYENYYNEIINSGKPIKEQLKLIDKWIKENVPKYNAEKFAKGGDIGNESHEELERMQMESQFGKLN
jgi:GNAT superfamily N-acetyltransferase